MHNWNTLETCYYYVYYMTLYIDTHVLELQDCITAHEYTLPLLPTGIEGQVLECFECSYIGPYRIIKFNGKIGCRLHASKALAIEHSFCYRVYCEQDKTCRPSCRIGNYNVYMCCPFNQCEYDIEAIVCMLTGQDEDAVPCSLLTML